MTTEELLAMCDRMSNIAGCIPKNKHIWNAHGVCQWCHQSRLIVDAAEMSAALRKSLADVERLTKERDEWQRSNAAAVAALTRIACANEEWLPTYIAKAREMLAGKERDERLQAALRHFTAMEAELAALRQRVPVAKHISEHCRNGLHGHCTDPECKCDCRYCVTTHSS